MRDNTRSPNVTICCSAIWYLGGEPSKHKSLGIDRGFVVTGLRHCNCFEILARIYPNREYLKNYRDGFLTSDNRFVNRQEAAIIAIKAGQIKELTYSKTDLFSEDLY